MDTGIAIGQCINRQPSRKPRQGTRHIDEGVNLISSRNEDVKRSERERIRVAAFHGHSPKRLRTDEGEVVCAVWNLRDDGCTRGGQRCARVALRDPWRVFSQPFLQRSFSTLEHRWGVPERVVQIQ